MLTIFLLVTSTIAAQCSISRNTAETAGSAQITINDAFAQAPMPNGAVYLTLMNTGNSDDALIGVETDVAGAAELHETMIDKNQIVHMTPLERIVVPAGGSAILEPGGQHIMLLELQEGLAAGNKFRITLNFEKSGSKSIEVEVWEARRLNRPEPQRRDGDADHLQSEHD